MRFLVLPKISVAFRNLADLEGGHELPVKIDRRNPINTPITNKSLTTT